MELFDLLFVGFVIFAIMRQLTRAGRQEGAPREPGEPPLEVPDLSNDMGDMLERMGFPRPSGPSRIPQAPPGRHDGYTEEEVAGSATPEPTGAVESRRRVGVREPRERIERGGPLADIAALAEAEARKRVRDPDLTRQEGTAPGPIAESERDRRGEGTSRAGSLLPQLDRYSELERAILYAEILGSPKALRE